jgi:hypothetical protein
MRRPMRIELVNENGETVVQLEIGGYLMHLGASDVDALIEQLGAVRAAMMPPVPGSVPRTHQYPIEVDPCWYAEPHPTSDAVVIFLRGTGIGWTGFAIPRDRALRFCKELSTYANTPVERIGLSH